MRVTLTTTGRKTGKPRSVTLYAWEDGDRLLVVGSRGGSAKDPDWVLNLRANPRAMLREGGEKQLVDAEEADGAEYERQWGIVTKAFPMYASFQRRTKRRIPVLALVRAAD